MQTLLSRVSLCECQKRPSLLKNPERTGWPLFWRL
jgi:hypothetical protein